MLSKRWFITLAPVAAACATLMVSTGTASANANVLTVIHQQNARVLSTGIVGRIRRLEQARHTRGDYLALARAFDVYGRDIDRAATAVSHASADSSRQVKGRHQWVLAAHDIATAVFKFAHSYRAALHGHRATALRLYTVAERERRAGLAAERRAVALLS